jgi:hypothetical protein
MKIKNKKDMGKLQIDLNSLGKFALQNEMKINPTKSKAVCFKTPE